MLYDLFSDFFDDDFFAFKPTHSNTVKDITCPLCKMRLSEFLQSGKFGCGNCYDAFGSYTKQVLNNIHSTYMHKGKVSESASEQLKCKREIESLKKQLASAVDKQDFESAAKLRDKINELEKSQNK